MNQETGGLYYGNGLTTLGPYHPDEMQARISAVRELSRDGDTVYTVRADSYEEARRLIKGDIVNKQANDQKRRRPR